MVDLISLTEDNEPVALRLHQLQDDESACVFTCPEGMQELIGQEVFLLSVPVNRYNKYGWRNVRILVLT